MIVKEGNSIIELYKDVFIELYENSEYLSTNPKHLKEAVAVVKLINNAHEEYNDVIYSDNEIQYNFPLHKIIPEARADIINNEIQYYLNKFIKSSIVSDISSAIAKDQFSKRLFYNFWQKKHLDPMEEGVCVSGCFFRVIDKKKLEIHVHSRANNAYSLLLIDMQFLKGFQSYLAKKNGLQVGDYYHFFDSVHFFVSDANEIHPQYNYIKMISSNIISDSFFK